MTRKTKNRRLAPQRRLGMGIENLESRAMLTTLPAGFTESVLATDLSLPTRIAFAPDGRLFILEKGGDITIAHDDHMHHFGHIQTQSLNERGLKGIAFHPQFETNGFFYLYYTTPGAVDATVHNRVSRFTANGDSLVAGSEVVLLDLPDMSSRLHNGGALDIGADGKLYITVGDNYDSTAPQRLDHLFGKVLRLNLDGSIPLNNPFYNATTGVHRSIWAIGVRNPYSSAVQPGTGRYYVNDVGARSWEEINEIEPGKNYGWPIKEGNSTDPAYTNPIFTYAHGDTGGLTPNGCSITGAAFYNPDVNEFPPEYQGDFFFADYCGGWINHYDPETDVVESFATETLPFVVNVEVSPTGALYYLTTGSNDGALVKIEFPSGQIAPVINTEPSSQTVAVGEDAMFHVGASGSGDLTYQWQRNDVDIPGATDHELIISDTTLADNGDVFKVIVTNDAGSATSEEVTLTVIDSERPQPTIALPVVGDTYRAGDRIFFRGTGSDAEDGNLPASAFEWSIVYHHDTHVHPVLESLPGVKSGSFSIPRNEEVATNVWYRIHLTVTDSEGLAKSTFRDIHPEVRTHHLNTSPAGLEVTLDGQPTKLSLDFDSVVGVIRNIGATANQIAFGKKWHFVGWSDGQTLRHNIRSPEASTTYTATFEEVPNVKPVVANYGPARQFTIGGDPVRISSTLTVTDPDGISLAGGRIAARISQNAQPGDKLMVQDGPRVTINGQQVRVDGVLIGTLIGQGTSSLSVNLNTAGTTNRAQVVMRSIFFQNQLANPGTAVRNIAMNVNDGLLFSNNVNKQLTIRSPQPNVPAQITVSSDPVEYTLNDPAVIVAPEAVVVDNDSENFDGGVLQVSIVAGADEKNRLGVGIGRFTFSGDDLSFDGTLIGTRNANGGIGLNLLEITFNASATKDIVQRLLRVVVFRTAANSTFDEDRTIRFSLTDGDGGTPAPAVTKLVQVS